MLVELVLLLLFTGALVSLFGGRRAAHVLALLSSIPMFWLSVSGVGAGGEVIPFLPTSVMVDSLSSLFLLVLSFLTLAISLYLVNYTPRGETRYLGLAVDMALLSAFLFLITNNLERLTLAYELFAVFTFVLIIASDTRGSRKAAWRYLVLTQVFGIIPLLLATGLAYSAVGDIEGLTFQGLSTHLSSLPVGLWVLYGLYLLPALVRSGVFPFHTWVARVYRSLPSPFIPVIMIGDLMGYYLMLRMSFFVLPHSRALGYVLATLGTVTAFATLYSFSEIHLRKKFAYHSIMDVGIAFFALGSAMVLGESLMGTVALVGSLLHILYQSLYKSSIFFGLGAIEHYGEDPTICSIRKLLRGHVISLLIALSAFSMAGVPPLAAFVSKWLIYEGPMGTSDVLLWLMVVTIAFLGIFPLASIIQVRRINRLLCKREVERGEIPLVIRGVTGMVALAGFIVAVMPAVIFPWLMDAIRAVGVPIPTNPAGLFFAHPSSALAGALLIASALVGWKVGKMPTDRVSELLLIFYNMGEILRVISDYSLDVGRSFYLRHILPVIKVVPKHELPLIKDYDDALDYPVRHLDEAMFMPLIRAVERLARWGKARNLDMNALISGFAIAMAVLIVLLGVFA